MDVSPARHRRSRLAIHHFADPAGPIMEMLRICRPGGTVTMVDMVAPEGHLQDRFDRLERLRDPAHGRALTRQQLRAQLGSLGARTSHTAGYENVIDGERWLAQASTPAGAPTRSAQPGTTNWPVAMPLA